ncbi:MAG TPA: serine hydrolase [Firmicutes bacterium]|nr:serine hydrolase [Bacillota bacterium]
MVLTPLGLVVARGGYWRIGAPWERSTAGTAPAPGSSRPAVDSAAAPDYEALRQELLEYLQGQDAVFGIYFKDLKSQKTVEINAEEPIEAASTVKVPVVLYLNTLVAEGKEDWRTRVTYNSATDYQDGAGILQFTARDGDSFSLRVLANLAITISDNIANRMLMRHLGRDNIIAFMKEIGGKTVYPGGQNVTTARDMAAYMEAVLDFAQKHPEEGKRLLDDMANPIYHVGLPGKLPPGLIVAHKEGDVSGVANDVGIVFASRPYILVVLSRGAYDVDQGFANIASISRIVYDYQESLS